MSLRIFTRAIKSISWISVFMMFVSAARADWNVDFSRRSDQMGQKEFVSSEAGQKPESKSMIDTLFQQVVPTEEIVILNTEGGFLPSSIRLREGTQYRFVVVNINEKAKNVSFVLDAFSEHHATYYGQMKSFYVNPKKAGIYTFVSPETSAKGRVIVQGLTAPAAPEEMAPIEVRTPASQGE